MLQFVLRPDVQRHYLGEVAATTWLIRADCNRLAEISEWGLYELMLTSLVEAVAGRLDQGVRNWLNELRRDAITGGSALLARRHVELATQLLCREHDLRLCFIFDEFDLAYRTLPAGALASLRALRDADRYRVSYVLMVRDHPEHLRRPVDCEGFYELISRSILGLKPYALPDAQRVIAQLAARRSYQVSTDQEQTMLLLSGGHPGLLVALFDVIMRGGDRPPDESLVKWALAQPQVAEECRKLWCGLPQDEQLALSRLVHGIGLSHTSRHSLVSKGLIVLDAVESACVFSPIFADYILNEGTLSERALWLDEGAAVVWVEGRQIADLSPLEFDLLRLLFRHVGLVCSRNEIISVLYPNEKDDGSDNRIDSLVRHLRKAIEPAPDHPRYLLTVRGRGYKLVDSPGT